MTQTDIPDLPTLTDGVTLLDTDDRATGALQSLVLDHVLLSRGDAAWVDSCGNGTTRPMAELASSMRMLERIHIARAFTPWQHLSLLQDLPGELTEHTSLVVLPDVDAFYRTDDVSTGEGARMLEDGVRRLTHLVDEWDVPVLITRAEADQFSAPLADVATDTLHCELTKFGPRFSGEEFETLVFPVGGGLVQTTLTYWHRILAQRHSAQLGARTTMDTDGAPEATHGAY